jgi:hypothetical protein
MRHIVIFDVFSLDFAESQLDNDFGKSCRKPLKRAGTKPVTGRGEHYGP